MRRDNDGAMVDSYEIYGENIHEDSEIEAAEEMARISNKRGRRGKTSSGRPGGFD